MVANNNSQAFVAVRIGVWVLIHYRAQSELEEDKEVRPPKRKITQDQVLEEQYKVLLLKQNNLKLQTKKLELEIALLELQVKREKESCLPLATVANLSPIAAGRPFLY